MIRLDSSLHPSLYEQKNIFLTDYFWFEGIVPCCKKMSFLNGIAGTVPLPIGSSPPTCRQVPTALLFSVMYTSFVLCMETWTHWALGNKQLVICKCTQILLECLLVKNIAVCMFDLAKFKNGNWRVNLSAHKLSKNAKKLPKLLWISFYNSFNYKYICWRV